MSNQGYYQGGPQYPQQAYGGYPQQGYPPQQGYGGGPPMQYQQGPPQQVIVKQKKDRGCLMAWPQRRPPFLQGTNVNEEFLTVLRPYAVAVSPKKVANAVPIAANAPKTAARKRNNHNKKSARIGITKPHEWVLVSKALSLSTTAPVVFGAQAR